MNQDSTQQSSQLSITAEPDDVKKWAEQVLGVVKRNQNQHGPLLTSINNIQELAKSNWPLITLVLFLIAWWLYGADPAYPIKKWADVSHELNSKLEKYEYERVLSDYYIKLGESFLDGNKFIEAQEAFTQAKKINGHSIYAQYSLIKSELLSFSKNKEFDPEVVRRRIELVERSRPIQFLQNKHADAHVTYAKARLRLRVHGTNESTNKTNDIKNLLEMAIKLRPHYAAAHGDLGLIALKENDYNTSIKKISQALEYSNYHSDYVGALSYAYEAIGRIDKVAELINTMYQLDPQVFAARLEILRYQLIYELKFDLVRSTCMKIPSLFEKRGLHEKNKNTRAYGLYVSGNLYTFDSWVAKKSYCKQFEVLSEYFINRKEGQEITGNNIDIDQITLKLKSIWDKADDGGSILPHFLINDLTLMCREHSSKLMPLSHELQVLIGNAKEFIGTLDQKITWNCEAVPHK